MDLTLWRWILGWTVSLLVGHCIISWGLSELREYAIGLRGLDKCKWKHRGIPPWLFGLIERIFFTLVIAFAVSGGAVAMIAWIAAKFAVIYCERSEVREECLPFMATSLYGSLASMLFALAGGLICRGGG